ncbi:MAG TPA: hypothetical protein VMZ03_03830 [Chitinophagaceae bacterium]|nr:hypothetical protein [Chitinophagaceae bacterium]
MLPIDFPEANVTFQKPAGWTDEQCSDLRVHCGNVKIDEAGTEMPAIISCWKLSKEDLEQIQHTGVIWLSITGRSMPPVSIFTEIPFIQQTNP